MKFSMGMSQQDILNLSNQDLILNNTTPSEQIEFIVDQIRNPFGSSSFNYFKRLRNMVKSGDQLDQYCLQLIDEMEVTFEGLKIDVSEVTTNLDGMFNAIYKFFVRNINKIMYLFLREYIMNSKNRKTLTAEYLNMKLPTYPKEQYGKKEYYILMTKLHPIIRSIRRENLSLEDFIHYLQRSESCPMYVEKVSQYLREGYVIDQGVVMDFFDMFLESAEYSSIYNKLQMVITEYLINPYLEQNNMEYMRLPQVEMDTEDDIDDDDEEEEDHE